MSATSSSVGAVRNRHRRRSTTPTGPTPSRAVIPGARGIARYAWGDDYHDVIGRRLDALLAWMRDASPQSFEARSVRRHWPGSGAGLRAVRRHRMDRQEHVRYQPESRIVDLSRGDHLQSAACRRRAGLRPVRGVLALHRGMPDAGIVTPGVLDSNKCISYLTIELRGDPAARGEPRHRLARMRLRRLPGGLSVERRRAAFGRRRVAAAAVVGRGRARGRSPRPTMKPSRHSLAGSAMRRAKIRDFAATWRPRWTIANPPTPRRRQVRQFVAKQQHGFVIARADVPPLDAANARSEFQPDRRAAVHSIPTKARSGLVVNRPLTTAGTGDGQPRSARVH